MIYAVIGLGLGVGAILGLVGAGGGIIAVPALVALVGLTAADAMATSLVMATASATTAVLPRIRGGVDWAVAGAVAAAGIPAAFAGTAVNAILPQPALLIAFAALMILAGLRMLWPISAAVTAPERRRGWLLRAIPVGIGVGFLTGLLGVGGGFVIVPALVLLLRMNMGRAIGTSLVIIAVNSAAGVIAHAGVQGIDVPVTLAFTIPAMVGSFIAARFARRVSGRALQIGFAILVLVVAVVTLATTLFSLW